MSSSQRANTKGKLGCQFKEELSLYETAVCEKMTLVSLYIHIYREEGMEA